MKARRLDSLRAVAVSCAAAMIAFCAHATEEVLWWQVEDPVVETFNEDVTHASDVATSARIRASDGNYLVIPGFEMGYDIESIDIPMESDGGWFALLPSDPASLSFMVELGNWENGNWVGIAKSQSYTYAELASHIVSDWSGQNVTPAISPWVAENFVAPEPSSGILLLIGGGLMALRRKRRR